MEDEKISIKVNIADRWYPLRIAFAEEERIRAAAKRINDRIVRYQQSYKNRDVQDALSIAVLQYVVKLMNYEEATDTAPLVDGVQQVDKRLGEYLQNIGD
jgi:cell division protein ZapA